MAINIQWDHKFEVGHERIDFEHRIFLGLIRDLSVEAERNPQSPRVTRMLLEIHKYAEFHFLSEENIMLDVGYPHLVEHHRVHQRILTQLGDKIHQYQHQGVHDSAEDIVTFMFEWFALHTTAEDKRIAEFIRTETASTA